MAGHKRPSFLKKQKEQQRKAWATEKRAARQARREAKNTEGTGPDVLDDMSVEGSAPLEGESPEAEPANDDVHRD